MTPEQWIAERTKVLDAERLPEPEELRVKLRVKLRV